ncbi:MAG: hypothetical protein EA362_04455 [Saprospirales bacterium]|nr:MAG: hypothetical protein EA362_04455 [Saprospirales bacterium]
MKILKELIGLLPPSKIKKIQLIGQDLDSDTKLGALYYAILDNEVASDTDASKLLYNDVPKSAAYLKLKQRLRERLLNTLFFIDVNTARFADYGTAMANCHQEYALVKLLLSKYARNSAIWLAEHLFEQTMKYEFTELNYLISSDLMNHYGLLELDRKKFNYYKSFNEDAKKNLDAEHRAAQALSLISFIKIDSRKDKKSDYKDFFEVMGKLDGLFPDIATTRFLLYYSNVKSSYYSDIKNYHGIIQLADDVLYLVDQKSFKNRTLIYSLNVKKMNSHFNLGELTKAINIAEEAKNHTKPYTQNWYIATYYKCLFLLHLKDYKGATKILDETISKDNAKYLSPILKEYWLTIQAYVELLKVFGKIETEDKKSIFRVQKFINDVPVYQKEKQGRKVAVLLVQLMFFLGRNEYGKYIDRLEALQQYRRRHLGEANTFRANCIIKMMTKVGKLSFHPVRVIAHTKKDLNTLSSMTPEFSNSSADVEIIPYEDLWQMVLEMLEKNLKN